MGTRTFIRCPCCGSLRVRSALGVDADDALIPSLQVYDLAVKIQEIGGRGICKWSPDAPVSLPVARTVLARLQQCVKELAAEIAEAEGE